MTRIREYDIINKFICVIIREYNNKGRLQNSHSKYTSKWREGGIFFKQDFFVGEKN